MSLLATGQEQYSDAGRKKLQRDQQFTLIPTHQRFTFVSTYIDCYSPFNLPFQMYFSALYDLCSVGALLTQQKQTNKSFKTTRERDRKHVTNADMLLDRRNSSLAIQLTLEASDTIPRLPIWKCSVKRKADAVSTSITFVTMIARLLKRVLELKPFLKNKLMN